MNQKVDQGHLHHGEVYSTQPTLITRSMSPSFVDEAGIWWYHHNLTSNMGLGTNIGFGRCCHKNNNGIKTTITSQPAFFSCLERLLSSIRSCWFNVIPATNCRLQIKYLPIPVGVPNRRGRRTPEESYLETLNSLKLRISACFVFQTHNSHLWFCKIFILTLKVCERCVPHPVPSECRSREEGSANCLHSRSLQELWAVCR